MKPVDKNSYDNEHGQERIGKAIPRDIIESILLYVCNSKEQKARSDR